MAEPTAAHARELGDYLSVMRRRWGWVVVSVLAGLLLGAAYLTYADVTYTSTAKVLVKETSISSASNSARTTDEINLDTEAQLVRSEPVAKQAAELLGTDTSPTTLAGRVNVTVPPNTTVLAISYTAGSAAAAQEGAETFARAYIENRQGAAQSDLDAQVKRLESQVDATQQDLQDTSAALARLTSASSKTNRAFLLARRAALSNQLAAYNSELAPLKGTEVHAGDIIVDAQLPKRPVNPNPLLILPAGLMLGLVVGIGLAAWRERTDKRIHTRAEVERVFGVAPVALSASSIDGSEGNNHDVVALYHQLRADGGDEHEMVVLVAPDDPEAAEELGYSLAMVAARSGSDTTYVVRPDAPELEERRTRAEATGLLQLPDYAQLDVMVDGELRLGELRQQVSELATDREFVILGLPNDDPAIDLPVLARHVDVAVVVIRLGKSQRSSVGAVLSVVSKFGVDRVVTVTVDRERRRSKRRKAKVETVTGEVVEPVDVSAQPSADDKSRTVRPGMSKGAKEGAKEGAEEGADAGRGSMVSARNLR
jgi:capsular polysaccharide biosynthesis protein